MEFDSVEIAAGYEIRLPSVFKARFWFWGEHPIVSEWADMSICESRIT